MEFVKPSLAFKLIARENVAFYMKEGFLLRIERASISIT